MSTRHNTTTERTTGLELAHSEVTLEAGPAGTHAKIQRDGDTDYAGPLDWPTVRALYTTAREVTE